jgi:outer membrane protein insertion porin family
LSQAELQSLQNYTQSSQGFTLTASHPLHHSFKRIGATYSFDVSSLVATTTASKQLFNYLDFSGLSGPSALNGIITSKLLLNYTKNGLDAALYPHSGTEYFLGAEFSGLGGTVRSIRPIAEWKHYIPVQKRRNAIGLHAQASYMSGYGGLVAPPFQRFYMGGENDLRGFDIRSVSPVAFIPTATTVELRNPDGSIVPKDPGNLARGAYTIQVPFQQITFPGGDLSLVTNAEYRVTIAGPVAIAPFVDFGVDPILRPSQLRINDQQFATLNQTQFGCPAEDPVTLNCVGSQTFAQLNGGKGFSQNLAVLSSANWKPRMSTGLELQVFLPVVNAPFRIYWAYNPVRLDEVTRSPSQVLRSMFPNTDAGEYTYLLSHNTFATRYQLREPRKTFRFTVGTTF